MPIGRHGSGIAVSFGLGFTSEIQKVAGKKVGDKKAGSKKEVRKEEKGSSKKNKILRSLVGAGIGGSVGGALGAATHGVQHLKQRKMYRQAKSFVQLFGPGAGAAFKKHFKPKFLRPELFRRVGAGGLAGAAPAAFIAALL